MIKQAHEKFIYKNKNDHNANIFIERIKPFFIFHNGDTISILDQNPGVFVLSFTERKDLLSQWRAYTPQCHGVSIGIESNFQNDLVTQGLLFPVIYDEKLQTEYADHLFESAFSQFITSKNNELTFNDDAISNFFSSIKAACTLMKNSSFDEEQEWRYIIYGENITNINFRSSEFYLIPYINLEINSEHLKSIIIGPNPHKQLCKQSIELLLRKMAIAANTCDSKIPFRG